MIGVAGGGATRVKEREALEVRRQCRAASGPPRPGREKKMKIVWVVSMAPSEIEDRRKGWR